MSAAGTMNRVEVHSSNVVSLGYDPDRQLLEVEYRPDKEGRPVIWHYWPVEQSEVDDLLFPGSSVGKLLYQLRIRESVKACRLDTEAAS